MVLFEHIDSYSTSLDLSGLIELGLINVDAFFNNGIMINDVYNKKAAEIMAAYKDDVIKYIRNSQYEKFYKRTLNSKKEISLFCMSPDQRILSLFDNFDEIVSNCDRLYVADAPFSFSEDNGINRILYCAIQNANVDIIIPSIKRYLAAGICLSEKNGTIFCSDIFKKPSLTKKTNIVDSIYYTVRAKLPDEINILPMPQTLDDVIELRKSPYIKSFRAVMSEWSHYIERGEFALASKVKNDAIRANRNLERLKKYKKFSTSPYTRAGTFIIAIAISTVMLGTEGMILSPVMDVIADI
jgi:hypothetical protein